MCGGALWAAPLGATPALRCAPPGAGTGRDAAVAGVGPLPQGFVAAFEPSLWERPHGRDAGAFVCRGQWRVAARRSPASRRLLEGGMALWLSSLVRGARFDWRYASDNERCDPTGP